MSANIARLLIQYNAITINANTITPNVFDVDDSVLKSLRDNVFAEDIVKLLTNNIKSSLSIYNRQYSGIHSDKLGKFNKQTIYKNNRPIYKKEKQKEYLFYSLYDPSGGSDGYWMIGDNFNNLSNVWYWIQSLSMVPESFSYNEWNIKGGGKVHLFIY